MASIVRSGDVGDDYFMSDKVSQRVDSKNALPSVECVLKRSEADSSSLLAHVGGSPHSFSYLVQPALP